MKNFDNSLKLSVLALLCFLSTPFVNHAQHFDFGYEYGVSAYFGDLTKFKAIPSASLSSASKGHYVGFGNRFGTIFLNYTVTEISASDEVSANSTKRLRNLNFKSPILEYGITTELNLLSFFHRDYTRLRPVAITGFNIFYFNPQAYYQGEWVELQRLGTEGQGSSYYPEREKYSLTQVSIPIGAGIKYDITKSLWIGMGAKLRLTFTDYLDDVSTTYVDPEKLAATNGALAAELAFRGDEIDPNAAAYEGLNRGNPAENDWYMTTYITVGARFREHSKPKRKRRKRMKRNKVRCPKF